MRPIPKKIRDQLSFEHALTFANRQINEAWAIIPVHPDFNNGAQGAIKRRNKWVAYLRLFYSDPLYYDSQMLKYNVNFREFVKLNFEFSISDYPELARRLCEHRITV